MAEYTEKQKLLAKIIRRIEMTLEPKCSECGYGPARPKCAFDYGGGCPRHDQEDLQNYKKMIQWLLDEAEFTLENKNYSEWRRKIPLIELYDFNSDEILDLMDVRDCPEMKMVRRKCDDKWFALSKKGAVDISSQYDKTTIALNERGLELINTYIEKIKC